MEKGSAEPQDGVVEGRG